MRWNLKEAVGKSLVRRTEIAYEARLREISWRKTAKSNNYHMVRSEMSANRVMRNISRFIEEKLGLKVNMTKSIVDRPDGLKYLGFGFFFDTQAQQYKARPHAKS